jgi:hypothetical protein
VKIAIDWLKPFQLRDIAELRARCRHPSPPQWASGRSGSRLPLWHAAIIEAILGGRFTGAIYDQTRAVVAEDPSAKNAVLGYVIYGVRKPVTPAKKSLASLRSPGSTTILEIVVDPLYRRRGIASQLLVPLIDGVTIESQWSAWMAVKDSQLDLQCCLRKVGVGRGLRVFPAGWLAREPLDELTAAGLSVIAADDRYIFHFPPASRVSIATGQTGKHSKRRA